MPFSFSELIKYILTLSWRRSLSYRNQFIDLLCKSMDWFLHDRNLRHERVKGSKLMLIHKWYQYIKSSCIKVYGTRYVKIRIYTWLVRVVRFVLQKANSAKKRSPWVNAGIVKNIIIRSVFWNQSNICGGYFLWK